MTKIVLPEGLTTIGENAFMRCAFTSIRLPNSLTTIESEAFIQCNGLTEVVIPEHVEQIGNLAFNLCSNLRDVYVLSPNTKCVKQGFNEKQTYDGFKYEDNNDGILDLNDFKNTEGKHPTMLHYPEGYDDKFLNPMMKYLYDYVHAQSQDEKDAVINRLLDEDIVPDYAQYDLTNGKYVYDAVNDVAYLKEPGEYFSSDDIIGNGDPSTQDFAGWKQFMFVTATKPEKKWPDTRMVDDKWYSMCLPFPMTATQIGNAFGNTTEVCGFSGVDVQTNGTKILITLKFKNKVIETSEHVPYMIHPGIKAAANGTGVITNTIVGVQLKDDFDRETVDEDSERDRLSVILTANQTTIEADGINYTFRGNYFKGEKLPAYTYYWWPGDATWAASFYKTMTADQVNWTPYTSVVLCDADNGAADAKMVYFIETEDELFEVDEEEMGIATEIVQPFSVTKRDPSFDGKVMNMNGQVVSDSVNGMNGLPKGIYIVNGKKYVVR